MRSITCFLAGLGIAMASPALAQTQDATVSDAPAQEAPTDAAKVTEPAPEKPEAAKQPVAKKPAKKEPVDNLKPGQFIWEKRAYNATDLRIIAVLDIQRLYVFDGDTLVGISTISAGKKDKPTPTGTFEILQKNIDHKSNLYSNAPMPYMQRLTWDGIALHAGHIPGYPASHGCVRLPLPFAKALFSVTKMKQPVTILADLNRPEPEPEPVVEPQPQPETTPAPQPEPETEPKLEVEPVADVPAQMG